MFLMEVTEFPKRRSIKIKKSDLKFIVKALEIKKI